MVTLLLPVSTTEEELGEIMSQIADTSAALNVDIMGGHTEVTAAVNKVVITGTAVGIAEKKKLVTTSGAKPGDGIVLTKNAGLEGTAIIAADKKKDLQGIIDEELLNEARQMVNNVSVVRDGLEAAAFGVSAMHDVTEGGVLGAVWEMCEASGTGAVIEYSKVPVAASTAAICRHYDIDPLKLISSGCMLIACNNSTELVKRLESRGISAGAIGTMTKERAILLEKDGTITEIVQPGADELYKAI
jgi:hydrogenase maturation factor